MKEFFKYLVADENPVLAVLGMLSYFGILAILFFIL